MSENRENLQILEEYYKLYLQQPDQFNSDWQKYFHQLHNTNEHVPVNTSNFQARLTSIQSLIDAYRNYGYMAANIDPLQMIKSNRDNIRLEEHDLLTKDLDRDFKTDILHMPRAKLRDIITCLERCYCDHLAFEYGFLRNQVERNWLSQRIEGIPFQEPLSESIKLSVYKKVFQADYFERFLGQKYVGKKRFSLEGSDSFIPLMDTLVVEASRYNVHTMVVGMAHRGRLNVLSNIFHKPAQQIFAEFEENYDPKTWDYGDVKYHLGYSSDRTTKHGNKIHLSLMFNPSHLESVNPVCLGSVRARQDNFADKKTRKEKMLPILVHGDAAIMGQGVCAETLNLARLRGYMVGGTIHIVINNQIGFTTVPHESRSTEYATDIAKGFQVPIIHVNNDYPLAVREAALIALEFRQKFARDVIIDLVSFRLRGHNETDEPAFTQPQMYQRIGEHKPVYQIYGEFLLNQSGVNPKILKQKLDKIEDKAKGIIRSSFEQATKKNVAIGVDSMKGVWADFENGEGSDQEAKQLNGDHLSKKLKHLIPVLTTVPPNFCLHPKLTKLLEQRNRMLSGEIALDWGTAEALAFGSILLNGYHIRLSGQDSQRGTFAHRHAVYSDTQTGESYVPLSHLSKKQGQFTVINSPLSEYSVLGFEYGYSLSDPRTLVIWEAQFGDFINGAQIIVDQFISSSFTKWYRLSAIVLLLPHGYEGQGPEHSSARPERFLQLCAKRNMRIANCSRPDQYFYLLRQQILGKRRIPLVIFSPKSILRLPQAVSKLECFSEKNCFQKILIDSVTQPKDKVRAVIFCSGKIIYDIRAKHQRMKNKDEYVLISIEQLYPFPINELINALKEFPKLKLLRWVQEEPINQGAWFFIENNIKYKVLTVIDKKNNNIQLECVARQRSASPAAGLMKIHILEQNDLIKRALIAV